MCFISLQTIRVNISWGRPSFFIVIPHFFSANQHLTAFLSYRQVSNRDLITFYYFRLCAFLSHFCTVIKIFVISWSRVKFKFILSRVWKKFILWETEMRIRPSGKAGPEYVASREKMLEGKKCWRRKTKVAKDDDAEANIKRKREHRCCSIQDARPSRIRTAELWKWLAVTRHQPSSQGEIAPSNKHTPDKGWKNATLCTETPAPTKHFERQRQRRIYE